MLRKWLTAALVFGVSTGTVQAQTITVAGMEIDYAHAGNAIDLDRMFETWRAEERGRQATGMMVLVRAGSHLSLQAAENLAVTRTAPLDATYSE